MKKILVLFVVIFSLFTVNAQNFRGLDKSPMDAISYPLTHKNPNKIIKVIYSRPMLKGRPLENLADYGKVWRTGANEATEIRFYKDVVFGGKKVKAGTYSLFTIPAKKEWTIILSTDVNVWGAYSYNKANDVVRVKAPVTKTTEPLEAFSMTFDKEMNLYMAWGDVKVKIPIQK